MLALEEEVADGLLPAAVMYDALEPTDDRWMGTAWLGPVIVSSADLRVARLRRLEDSVDRPASSGEPDTEGMLLLVGVCRLGIVRGGPIAVILPELALLWT